MILTAEMRFQKQTDRLRALPRPVMRVRMPPQAQVGPGASLTPMASGHGAETGGVPERDVHDLSVL